MNQHLKFSNGSNIFFSSDTHFHHIKEFLWRGRGFNSVEEHDAALINNWNNKVSNNDIVFFLGDFIFYVDSSQAAMEYLKKLNFKILYMLYGNHNAGVRQLYKESLEEQFGRTDIEVYPLEVEMERLGSKVVFLGNYQQIIVERQIIVLSHYAFRNFDKMADGAWALAGHSHSNDSGINPDNFDRKVLDVGVDNFPAPLSFYELKNIMDGRKMEINDHHVNQRAQAEKL